MRKLALYCAMAIGFNLHATAAHAGEMAIIVNPAAGVDSLSSDDIIRIFLGKSTSFPNEMSVTPIAHKEGTAIRNQFDSAILHKSASQVKAYWAQQVFTGRGSPPDEYASDEEIKKLVASNPSMIGYIESSAVDSTVKVVLKVN